MLTDKRRRKLAHHRQRVSTVKHETGTYPTGNRDRAGAVMFLGTGSESGKSVLAAGFCRLLHRRGIRVAPFKAQNMALNSGVTHDGKEMGRAQIVQAEAAGIEPDVDMNPILLKPVAEKGSQVVVRGVARGNLSAAAYQRSKRRLWRFITESYTRLARRYDIMVLEGAGSPVEVNLKKHDIVNMAMARYAGAAVVLVADIDRGGVFASIIGTMELLEPAEREQVIGFIINKFRGDRKLLRKGLEFIERQTGKPVLGVMPMLRQLYIPGEDSVSLDRPAPYQNACQASVTVGIVRLPHLSNYTDFDPLLADPRFCAQYLTCARQVFLCDVCIIPGSKNVAEDLRFLRECGFVDALTNYYGRGGKIVGVCGGYQMLGLEICDPHGMESRKKKISGIGLLSVITTFNKRKTTRMVKCRLQLPGQPTLHDISGYEIHKGVTKPLGTAQPWYMTPDKSLRHVAGISAPDGKVWGTYVHGIFDDDGLRDSFLRWAKGTSVIEGVSDFSYRDFKEKNYDMLADAIARHVDVDYILKSINYLSAFSQPPS